MKLVTVSTDSFPAASNSPSGTQVISADGSRIAYFSGATDLVPGQTLASGVFNVFVYSRATGTTVLASGAGSSPTTGGDNATSRPMISSDGSVVVYGSYSSDLVPGDFNGMGHDVFSFQTTYSAPSTSFHSLTPCRVIDTRGPVDPFGGPALAGDTTRPFSLVGRCGIPIDAVAVSANVAVVSPAADGTLSFCPAGFAPGGTSTVSYRAGRTRANNTILGLGAGGATAVAVLSPGATDLVIDVNGYFK
jgi:hypothetical protein